MDFAELREQKSAPWLIRQKTRCLVGYCLSPRCRCLHLDFGNTEVLAWDLGKKNMFFLPISGCRNLHVASGNSLTYYILPWFFPQWIRGPSFRDLVSFFADLLARRTPNPSPPQIRRITINKYSTKKTCLNYDRIGDRLFWLVLPRVQ